MYGRIVNAGSYAFALAGRKLGRMTIPRAPLRSALGYAQIAPAGRVFKNSHQNLLKKVSILSAFRLLIFNTFKVKIVL